MILQIKKILTLIPAGHSLEIFADGHTFSDTKVRAYMRVNFGKQAFLYENDTETETAEEVADEFYNLWLLYNDMFEDMLNKSMAALTEEYNPLENYNRIENEDVTETRKKDNTETTYGDTVTTHYGQYEEETGVTTYDTTYKDERKTTKGHTPQNNDTEGHTGTVGTETTYGDKTLDRDITVHGNIGVMSSQSMLIEELKVRQFNLYAEFINRFVREYCFTTWGCCS